MTQVYVSDKYGKNFLAVEADGSINANAVLTPSSDFPVEIKNAADDTRAVVKTDGTNNALVVMQNSVPTHAVTQSGTWNIGTVTTITNDVNVTATNLDIRDLTNASDSVLIYGSDDGGTTKRVIKTDSGGAIQVDLEVASVTVSNAGAGSAVNIQDGGNSITVDAENLDIRDLASGTDSVSAVQSGTWNVNTVTALTGITNALPGGTNTIGRVAQADECQRILTSDDAVTTVNYSDATKAVVSNIVTSSSVLTRKVTDTYDNSGVTTLVITRVVADV